MPTNWFVSVLQLHLAGSQVRGQRTHNHHWWWTHHWYVLNYNRCLYVQQNICVNNGNTIRSVYRRTLLYIQVSSMFWIAAQSRFVTTTTTASQQKLVQCTFCTNLRVSQIYMSMFIEKSKEILQNVLFHPM